MLGYRIRRTLKMGLKSLWMHRLRSALTVLGIVFGVCSVIAMLAIGEGASREAQEQIRQLGSQNIIIRSVKPPEDQKATSERTMLLKYGLTYEDAERIVYTLPNVEVMVSARVFRQDIWSEGRRVDGTIVATVPWHPATANIRVAEGRFFSPDEARVGASVCVLGPGVARELFPIDDPLGRTIRVSDNYYRVIGVVESLGQGTAKPGGESRGSDTDVYIPLTTAQHRFGDVLVKARSGSFEMEEVQLHQIIVKTASLENVIATAEAIRSQLARFHAKEDYTVVVPLELLRQAERTKRIFSIVLGSIAAISLLVGGIGIMNIMLATVTERTREIGIRRAMGAKRRDIILQFLTETVLRSGGGGLLGVGLGVLIPLAVSEFTNMATVVTPWSLILAFSISVAIGVIFGLYPAGRAANMDPIEALRHE
ncbi:MAG TPA: ABC transporter permease [Candidatus Brocadiia bacterium]|nr:ABC transporter permease [Candidatus Brocadiia bacterium]